MNNFSITIQERTQNFAIRAIKAYSEINKQNHYNSAVVVISKQFLRSSTSIGANVAEAVYAQSNKDFLSKYSIALKEASETRYWITIMIKSGSVTKNKMSKMNDEIDNIIRILTAITKKLKEK